MRRYFDHEGEACSLRVLMSTGDTAALQRRLDHGSPSPAARGPKPGRHRGATTQDGFEFYRTFVRYLKAFFDKVRLLKQHKAAAVARASAPDAGLKDVFFYRHPALSIDSTESSEESKVWLGLGKEDASGANICKPVAIKSSRRSRADPNAVARTMEQMKPGSFIASAFEMPVRVHGLPEGVSLEDASPDNRSAPASSAAAAAADAAAAASGSQLYWVSEAGICTLHELLERDVQADERKTQAHRRLVKEVRRDAPHGSMQ